MVLVDSALVAAFGSETRVRTLAVLANATRPLTAYRVALVGAIPVDKAYREVRRLAAARLVERRPDGWVLTDGDLRSLLRRRVRIRWDKEWDQERQKWPRETPKMLSSGLGDPESAPSGPRISSSERLETDAGGPTNNPRTQSTGRKGRAPSTKGAPSVFPGGLGE